MLKVKVTKNMESDLDHLTPEPMILTKTAILPLLASIAPEGRWVEEKRISTLYKKNLPEA